MQDDAAGDGGGGGEADNTVNVNPDVASRLTDLFQLMDAQGAPLMEQPVKEPLSLAEEILERELAQTPPEALTGELWERIELSDAADSPFKVRRTANRDDRGFGWEMSSRGAFRDARRFPSTRTPRYESALFILNKGQFLSPRSNPLTLRFATLAFAVFRQANDVRKAKQCAKYVGDGCAGSYTDFYRRAAGELGNCSSYLAGDRVYVSVNGDREGRVRPVDAAGFLTGTTINPFGTEHRRCVYICASTTAILTTQLT